MIVTIVILAIYQITTATWHLILVTIVIVMLFSVIYVIMLLLLILFFTQLLLTRRLIATMNNTETNLQPRHDIILSIYSTAAASLISPDSHWLGRGFRWRWHRLGPGARSLGDLMSPVSLGDSQPFPAPNRQWRWGLTLVPLTLMGVDNWRGQWMRLALSIFQFWWGRYGNIFYQNIYFTNTYAAVTEFANWKRTILKKKNFF